ncbi:response regulator transcription factor [Sporosarcina pasteurii]|uniref:Heme response regulator HssR n=1 Tax=Sporosarcina pasteurii TaxID=1474 RepID=A0A380BB84_SPOPA|nr:response regulator transcription factor [Sporosarcina pasteurii]MDS9472945.1 response regulator transcription factor [Sporosarcina pasteurii]QBQ06485.1 response regulator transcription factor [Sporosarcina pasteurii]SUI98347.1 Heme response regulator hssR [Sporosarcina pasteurii]
MLKILVVDDDPNILELVSIQLTQAGYAVQKASNGFEALEIIEMDYPDLVVVDVMMPGMDGYTLTRKIRSTTDIPVLLLTAKGELADKEKGFLSGSDDYVVKPFEPKELQFRINAILRRYDKAVDAFIQAGPLNINRQSYEVLVGNKILLLPLKEFELLSVLASRLNTVFTRDILLERVWGYDYEGDEQTLNVHIKRVREKLQKLTPNVKIATVRGVGYKLEVLE